TLIRPAIWSGIAKGLLAVAWEITVVGSIRLHAEALLPHASHCGGASATRIRLVLCALVYRIISRRPPRGRAAPTGARRREASPHRGRQSPGACRSAQRSDNADLVA